ncbi:hypothetical protein EAG_08280 [Camponotus floridanus]|uniref:Uncharacterized protein n=1 Tax=Camponotus floridanus TaxID=104421 RepID=E2API1_CAMFO|nr:uncharacterized protein LOC105254618 [Camponotus floridanus]EFN64637.1 hypothetical protein EAG_08280 [Camponotus floridanus]
MARKMNKLLALVLLAACVVAEPINVSVQPSQDLDCLQHDMLFSCMLVKTISTLDRAARSNDIEIVDGVTFIRDIPMERTGKSLKKSELEILHELPRDNSDKMIKLFSMLYESAVSFLKSHSLKLNMPGESITRTLVEGRAKIKKIVTPLIAAMGIKLFALVPILLGGLGLLALKALFFGKIALLVAGIVAFQKLFGGSNVASSFFGKNPTSIFYDTGASGNWPAASSAGAYQGYRSFDIDDAKVDAHNLAYSAHVPDANDTN